MAIYLVRHGKASHGRRKYDVLQPLGVRQAESAADALLDEGVTFWGCLCGPLARQFYTYRAMEHLAWRRGIPWPLPNVVAELNEVPLDLVARRWLPRRLVTDPSFWKYWSVLRRLDDTLESNLALGGLYNDLMRRWQNDEFGRRFETYARFVARMRTLATRLEREGAHRNLLVVTSVGVIYAMVAYFEHGPDAPRTINEDRYANGSITVVEQRAGRFQVVRKNDVAHLRARDLVSYL